MEVELNWLETPDVPLDYRVEKMRLSKDKTQLKLNDSLTLGGIPPEVFDYRLGNRSALDWVIDQYRVKTDKRSGITSDPNRPDDPEYIVRLVGQVVRVSLETVKNAAALPEDYGAESVHRWARGAGGAATGGIRPVQFPRVAAQHGHCCETRPSDGNALSGKVSVPPAVYRQFLREIAGAAAPAIGEADGLRLAHSGLLVLH